jgi:superfamily II DNA helicase RecQ
MFSYTEHTSCCRHVLLAKHFDDPAVTACTTNCDICREPKRVASGVRALEESVREKEARKAATSTDASDLYGEGRRGYAFIMKWIYPLNI